MKGIRFIALLAVAVPTVAGANAWKENFVRWSAEGTYVQNESEPENIPSAGDIDSDLGSMYRKGYVPIGYSLFESGNEKTRDGERWAKELGASHVIFGVDLQSSSSFAVPLTLPSTTTSRTNGNATVFGSNGSAFGNFNSTTTTTTGTQTTYIPVTKSRFSKFALYFAPEQKFGAGVYARAMSPEEMQALGTRFALAVRFVRDFSPAYYADILPGDIIMKINGTPAEPSMWWAEILDAQPDQLDIIRGDKAVSLIMTVPEDWRTLPKPVSESEK